MSDSGDLAQDRQREIDAEYEFYHGERTDLEIVQEAQRLLIGELDWYCDQGDEEPQNVYRAFLAHKAFFERHGGADLAHNGDLKCRACTDLSPQWVTYPCPELVEIGRAHV